MAILTLTGDLASGKSMVAKELIHLLDAQYFSTGNIQRGIAASMGMTTLELNKYSETHPEIDDQIDGQIKELAGKEGNFVVDSRMAWHFLPESFKIYLSVDVHRAAMRVMKDDQRSSEPAYNTIEDAVAKLLERKGSENKRYITLYDANCADMSNFDVVVDSTHSTPEQTLSSILALSKHFVALKQNNQIINHYWLSPKHLYPTQAPSQPCDNQLEMLTMEPVEVVQVNQRFYLWQNADSIVAQALNQDLAHVPVRIIATDEQKTPDGKSASEYVSANFNQQQLNAWADRFSVEYL